MFLDVEQVIGNLFFIGDPVLSLLLVFAAIVETGLLLKFQAQLLVRIGLGQMMVRRRSACYIAVAQLFQVKTGVFLERDTLCGDCSFTNISVSLTAVFTAAGCILRLSCCSRRHSLSSHL